MRARDTRGCGATGATTTLGGRRLAGAAAVALLPAGFAADGGAQQAAAPPDSAAPLVVTASIPADFIDRRSVLALALNRRLRPHDGELAVVVGTTDVTDLMDRGDTTLVYRPAAVPLPTGEGAVIVYRRLDGRWEELQRFPIRVLARGGLARAELAPSATLGNTGQIAEGRTAGVPAPERRSFQDLTLAAGMRSAHDGRAWGIETQGNVSGASRQEEALRFGTRGARAPRVDLSDYLVTMRARSTRLALGHVSVGTHRHLVNGFGSRGVTFAAARGPTSLSLGMLNGATIVGWDNLVGLRDPAHRVATAVLTGELRPSRPGALRVDASLLDGALRPEAGVTQGAIVDAERSRGTGVQLGAATAGQRLRLNAGWSSSRFVNPATDAELLGDTTVVAVRPERRAARFLELGLRPVQERTVPLAGALTMEAVLRHERIEPLYRSVAASVQADRLQDAAEMNVTLGPLTSQVTHAWGHDNLDRLPTVLRTDTRQTSATVALPLAGITALRRAGALRPTLSYTFGHTHQWAGNVPTNDDFRPQDLPDQVSATHEASAQWQRGRVQLGYRYALSEQDNRQVDRERADLVGTVHALATTVTLNTRADVTAEASREWTHAREHDEHGLVRRLALLGNWRAPMGLAVVAAVSATHSRDTERPDGARNMETRLELSRGIGRRAGGDQSRGQLFVRWAWVVASPFGAVETEVADVPPPRSRRQWTLASGLSLRVLR